MPEIAPAVAAADVEPAQPSLRLAFSEIFPDPAGKDTDGEFIELLVTGSGSPEGWSIVDGHERIFQLGPGLVAGEFIFLAYSRTKIPLPNDGGWLVLKEPGGAIADRLEYSAPVKEGSAYARVADGGWAWTTTPTPAATNAFPVAAAPPPSASSGPGSTSTTGPEATDATMHTLPAVPPASSPPMPATPPPRLRLSELLPNPIGDDALEWIEIANEDAAEAALAGWSLTDRSGDRFVFSDQTIAGGGVIIVTKSVGKISLNNDGDDLSLVSPGGAQVDATTYPSAPEGKSWARIGDVWTWTDLPTPGQQQNVEFIANYEEKTTPAAIEEKPAETAPTKPEEPPAIAAELDELPEIDEGAVVEISGTVSVAPGALGKRSFAIQDESGAAFVRVRGTQKFSVAAGDLVRLRGKLSRRGPESNVSAVAKDIKKIGRVKKVPAADRDLDALGPTDAGLLVALEGKISHRTKRTIFLADDRGRAEMRVMLPAQGMPDMEIGSRARITGIVRYAKEAPEITVIDRAGVVAVAGPPAIAKQEEPAPQTLVLSSSERRATNALAAAAVVGAVSAGCLAAFWHRKKRIAEIEQKTT